MAFSEEWEETADSRIVRPAGPYFPATPGRVLRPVSFLIV